MKFENFSNSIFSNLTFCLSSNKKTVYYLKKLGAKNIKYFGNLKYAQSENEKIILEKNITNLNKQFLHAKTIGFIHPNKNKEMIFDSILPKELEIILKMLRNTSK